MMAMQTKQSRSDFVVQGLHQMHSNGSGLENFAMAMMACSLPPQKTEWLIEVNTFASLDAYHLAGDPTLSAEWIAKDTTYPPPKGLSLLVRSIDLMTEKKRYRNSNQESNWCAFKRQSFGGVILHSKLDTMGGKESNDIPKKHSDSYCYVSKFCRF